VKSSAAKVVVVPVSKSNFNRVKFKTSTLEQVLKNEGYTLDYRSNPPMLDNGEELIPLNRLELEVKPRNTAIRKISDKVFVLPEPTTYDATKMTSGSFVSESDVPNV
jgi:hypothetical protein